jgi:crotonobetaine/carnitine-CoA ligase
MVNTLVTAPAQDVRRPPSSTNYSAGQSDTVLDALQRAVDLAGHKIFLDIQGETITYAEMDRRATQLAHSLASLGVKKGDTVVTFLDTSIDVVTCWFGINKLGAIWVPINNAYRHEFLRHQIADAAAKLVICDVAYLDRVIEIAQQLPDVSLILCRGNGPFPACDKPIEPFDRIAERTRRRFPSMSFPLTLPP